MEPPAFNTTPTHPSVPHPINLPQNHRQVRGCKTLEAICPPSPKIRELQTPHRRGESAPDRKSSFEGEWNRLPRPTRRTNLRSFVAAPSRARPSNNVLHRLWQKVDSRECVQILKERWPAGDGRVCICGRPCFDQSGLLTQGVWDRCRMA